MDTQFSNSTTKDNDRIQETEEYRIILTSDPIDLVECMNWGKHPKAGAISSFIGTTRDNFDGKRVLSLEYSSYPDMAIKEMLKLCDIAKLKFSNDVSLSSCCSNNHISNVNQQDEEKISKISLDNSVKKIQIIHRLGKVEVMEPSIVITVTTPHRELGLKACQFLIDEVKIKVPIWKKEQLEDQSEFWK